MSPEDLLAFAEGLADVADRITTTAFRAGLEVRTKADGSWVTDADEHVETELSARIRDQFPDHVVFGEEHGTVGSGPAVTWVIDPIDGTSNFVRGNPVFATLIAVQVDGVEQCGVVS
ncbi:MAG: inositol monophosphatase family protein, partial [Nitriliruptoraceae bacterium]